MTLGTFFHQIRKAFLFRILATEFFFHPLYMKAFFILHRLTNEEIREYQLYRLQRLLRYAQRAIPYGSAHIKNSLTNSSTFNIEDFERLPILTREMLVVHGDECVVRDLQRHEFRTFVTSGSTGIPKKFVGNKIYFRKLLAATEFYVNLLGVSFKQFGFATHKSQFQDLVTYIPAAIGIDALQKLLRDKNVLAVGGPLHRLISLAKLVNARKIQFKPKFVLSWSEFLTTGGRKYLERVFQCPVYNKYVCTEAGSLGLECPERGGFHVNPVNCYLEIVDDNGSPVEKGAKGRIVITTFNNRLMPLIRYDIGDIGEWVEGNCTCGLSTPRLLFEGRTLDYIEFTDGKKLSAISLIRRVDTEFANIIAKQQIVQESLDKIVFKFVPGPGYYPPHNELIYNFIRDIITSNPFRRFPEISIEVVKVQFLDNLKNGKYVVFESYVKK